MITLKLTKSINLDWVLEVFYLLLFIILLLFFFFNVLLQIENVQHMYIWKGRMLDVLWQIYIYALYIFLNVIELRMRDDTFLQIQIVV